MFGDKPVDIVFSMGNQQITGKGTFITNLEIKRFCDEPRQLYSGSRIVTLPKPPSNIEIELSMVVPPDNFFTEWWEDDYKPPIRNKKVEDCTIQELLFAVRKKIK